MNKRTLDSGCQNEKRININEGGRMHKTKSLTGLALVAAVGAVLVAPSSALAVPAFARVNNLPCATCHTNFPKLTAFGENFMRNGFQLQEGGAEPARRDLSFASALDFLAIRGRMKLYESKNNQTLGTTEADATVTAIGQNENTYLYVAGSAWKNISVWMENSLLEGNTSNYALGFHNLGGSSLANIRFGQFTNTEWLSVSNQKRFLDPSYIAYAVKTSKAAGLDRVSSGGATNSAELYGYSGPIFYGVGYTPGASATANSDGNYWGTMRFDVLSGAVAGSNISAQYYSGTDTNATTTALGKNKFSFTNIGANLRLENLELYGFYVMGKEDNYDFAGKKRDHTGLTAEANYLISPEVSAAVRYEVVNSDDDASLKKGLLTPGIVYSPYENIRIMAYYAMDMDKDGDGKKSNVFLTNLQFAF